MFEPSTVEQLAASFALRPGMYVGDCIAPDQLVELFVEDVLNPEYGPTTRDCLHDVRAQDAIRSRMEEAFGHWLDHAAGRREPPWQLMGGLHDGDPWMETCAEMLSRPAGPPFPDPYVHRDDNGESRDAATELPSGA